MCQTNWCFTLGLVPSSWVQLLQYNNTLIYRYSDLNEASLLWNLKIRYDKELIYVSPSIPTDNNYIAIVNVSSRTKVYNSN